ncbi:unnamed protein product [Protopolystoma xenopodis]|uniref:EF-hand domain-containing protein n=1 Tax=Protopolystoma xenopodis TaxID=117903 RepID=A0A3S5ANN9_9PLAT|nr:unnamed protein product [Protopolystoma xenopodis]
MEQQQEIINNYLSKDGRSLNWKKFVNDIEEGINQSNLENSVAPSLVNTSRSRHSSTIDNFGFKSLFSRINKYLCYRGDSIRKCYKDFDIHNMGRVSESQFYRAFPNIHDITDSEISALANCYKCSNYPGFIDYFALEKDMQAIKDKEENINLNQSGFIRIDNLDLYLHKHPLLNPFKE